MTLAVWRIGLATARSAQDHSFGSTLAPGRWHSLLPGPPRRVIYAASSRALAQLEKRVHANGVAPVGQALFKLTLPARLAPPHVRDIGLPERWRDDDDITRAVGDSWLLEGKQLALWVPSFVEPAEDNLLVNALHARVGEVRIAVERQPFEFDPRLA